MTKKNLEEMVKDAHAHFFLIKGDEALRLGMWEIGPNYIVVDVPSESPLRKTALGYIPTLDGKSVYEIEGKINADPLPDQMSNTIRIEIDLDKVKKINRRLYARYNFAPPIKVDVDADTLDEPVQGRLINLSAGGLRLETELTLEANKIHTFTFEIELDNMIHSFAMDGNVLYEIPLDEGYAYGVKFDTTPEEDDYEQKEVSVETLDRTVDLMGIINKLLMKK